MAIGISQNLLNLLGSRSVERVPGKMADSYRLASGQISNPDTDASANTAPPQIARQEIRSVQQNIRTANEALGLSATANSALGEIGNLLQGLRTMAQQAASSSLSDEERAALQDQSAAMLKQIDGIANSTTFGGKTLLNGSASPTKIFSGNPDAQFVTIALADARSSALGRSSQDAGTPSLAFLSLKDPTAAQQAVQSLDLAIGQISSQCTALAATQNQLQTGIEQFSSRLAELASAGRQLSDSQAAQESARMAQLLIMQDARTAIRSQANLLPRTTLNLLSK